jgi:hypothetical protein
MIEFSQEFDGTKYAIEQQSGFTRQFNVFSGDEHHQIVKDDFDEWHTVDPKDFEKPIPVNEIGEAIDSYAKSNGIEI